jgi:hypothetical protein
MDSSRFLGRGTQPKQLETMLDTIEHQLCHRTIIEVLILWKDTHVEDATWGPTMIIQQFPHIQPRGQHFF